MFVRAWERGRPARIGSPACDTMLARRPRPQARTPRLVAPLLPARYGSAVAETHATPTVQHTHRGLPHIYRQAFGTYRSRFLKVAGAALIIFGSLSLLDTGVDFWAKDVEDDVGGFTGGVLAVLLLFSFSAVVFGSAFYAGFLDHVVGEHQHGHEQRPMLHVLRTLPYRRLIAASVLLAIIVSLGMLVFFLPGIILFTLFCLVGPVINIENRIGRCWVRSSGRRSLSGRTSGWR
jgi:hypothetical protein